LASRPKNGGVPSALPTIVWISGKANAPAKGASTSALAFTKARKAGSRSGAANTSSRNMKTPGRRWRL